MSTIAIIGGKGQLGTDLTSAFRSNGHQVTPLGRSELDVCDAAAVQHYLHQTSPDIIVNCAAFHQVDQCEDDCETSLKLNALALYGLANACEQTQTTLVHFSTDYVFGGETDRGTPFDETDAPSPVNVYGVSKLAGEQLVRNLCRRHFVIRVSGLFGVAGVGGNGGNFVETMLRIAKSGKPLQVVDDQRLSPTSTQDLAASLVNLVTTDAYGLYHRTNSEDCSWYEFAREIFRQTGVEADLDPTTTAKFGARAPRPHYSVLGNRKAEAMGLAPMRPWHEALTDYLAQKGHIQQQMKKAS